MPLVVGETSKCPQCGTLRVSMEKTWQGKTTLSWRNPDGKSHKVKDENGNWVCRIPATKDDALVEAGEAVRDAERRVGGVRQIDPATLDKSVQALAEIEAAVVTKLSAGGQKPADAHVGLWVKLLWDQYSGLSNRA